MGESYGTVQNCYSTATLSGTGNLRVGGLVGHSYRNIINSVALSLNVTGTSAGRVTSYSYQPLFNNYARNDMMLNGSLVTTGIGPATIHGADTSAFNTSSFWTTAGNWDNTSPAFAWDFSSTGPWDWSTTKNLPILRGLGGQ